MQQTEDIGLQPGIKKNLVSVG